MADKVADAVTELYSSARREADTRFRSDWDMFWDFYMAKQWEPERPSYKCDVVTNLLFSNIETIKPILTDNRPNFMVLARTGDQGDREKAEIANACLRYVWDVVDMDMKLPEGLTSGLSLGTAFWQVGFNRWMNEGLGELDVMVPHPKLVHPDPAATNMRDLRFMIIESFPPLSLLREIYGEKAAKVKSDVSTSDIYSRLGPSFASQSVTQGLPSYAAGSTAPTDIVSYNRTNVTDGSGGDCVRLLRAWIRPEGSGALGHGYPSGTIIHVANGVTLRNVRNPYSWCPVAKFVDHALPSCFWGMGEIQETLTIQKALNTQLARLSDHSGLCSNPRMLCDASIYEDIKDKLTNKPGEIIPIENPDGRALDSLIHWQVPPNIPGYTMKMVEIWQRVHEIVSGVHDVTQGRAPAGIEAGIAIEALQVETKRRIGLKVRNMEAMLKDLAKLLLSGVEAFWSTERVVKVAGEMKPVTREMFKDFEYDVKVVAGSSLPVDKTVAVREAEELLKMGVYDEQQVLEVKDPPNKDEIIARMKPIWAMKRAIAEKQLETEFAMIGQPPQGPPQRGGM